MFRAKKDKTLAMPVYRTSIFFSRRSGLFCHIAVPNAVGRYQIFACNFGNDLEAVYKENLITPLGGSLARSYTAEEVLVELASTHKSFDKGSINVTDPADRKTCFNLLFTELRHKYGRRLSHIGHHVADVEIRKNDAQRVWRQFIGGPGIPKP